MQLERSLLKQVEDFLKKQGKLKKSARKVTQMEVRSRQNVVKMITKIRKEYGS